MRLQPLLYASREYDWHKQLLAAWDTLQDLRQTILVSDDTETETEETSEERNHETDR